MRLALDVALGGFNPAWGTPTPSGFTDSFTDTNGALLQSHSTGWTKAFGADFDIQSNAVAKTAAAGPAAYYRPDDGLATPQVKADILFALQYWIVAFGSGTSNATFNAYVLRWSGSNEARLSRVDNGTINFLGTGTITLSGSSGLGLEMRPVVNGSQVDIGIYEGGALVTTITDSSASRKTSGRRGLYYSGASSSVINNMFDNYSDNGAAS